ncbi:hypothetical protein MANES_07G081166v8 [Manihot esculenta]|uniref:Uncharacterized protein n=1 Tax=Manihot esculenta TaxID=3983 RepID=A0ACB7HEP1_MANES|nr:hypothetical protein MANES_07G081166v8 [Manihot esculenta]
MCKLRNEGGLGIKDIVAWNKAAVGRQIWDLATARESLRVAWMRRNRLKWLSLRGIIKPFEASWVWRNLVNTRKDLKGYFMYKLERGNFSFCFDPWMEDVAWTNIMRYRVNDQDDQVTRKLSSTGEYTIDSARQAWRRKRPLVVKARLVRCGLVPNAECCLCQRYEETVEHLFFRYAFLKVVWADVMQKCGINTLLLNWRKELVHKESSWKEPGLYYLLCYNSN